MISLIKPEGVRVVAGVIILVAACIVTARRADTRVQPAGSGRPAPQQQHRQQGAALGGGELLPPPPSPPSSALLTGRDHYQQACAMCHGVQGQGMPHQGPSLTDSAFVARSDDAELSALIRAGRLPSDPHSVMRLYMPPRGGNPSLTDDDVTEIVHHLRRLRAGALPSADAAAALEADRQSDAVRRP
jgi:disulfide bond formation protein DsbB